MKQTGVLVVLEVLEFNFNLKIIFMILGVCEWLSTKSDFEAKNIRIAFVVAFLLGGLGLGVYLILWLVKMLSK